MKSALISIAGSGTLSDCVRVKKKPPLYNTCLVITVVNAELHAQARQDGRHVAIVELVHGEV